jgi:hypothetical protein
MKRVNNVRFACHAGTRTKPLSDMATSCQHEPGCNSNRQMEGLGG